MKSYRELIKAFVLLVMGFMFFQPIASQQQFSLSLVWEEPRMIEKIGESNIVLRFIGQKEVDDATRLPMVSFEQPLASVFPIDSIRVKVVSAQWEYVSPLENKYLAQFSFQDELVEQKSVSEIMQKPILNVRYLPFRRTEDPRLHQRLVSLTVEVVCPAAANETLLKSAQTSYASSSVLSKGKWVKIKVGESGIYRIPYSKLTEWGFSNPSKVKVYGNGGGMLPKANSVWRPDDLMQNPVYHESGSIFFYAQGPVKWLYNSFRGMFMHQLHDYSTSAFYFLSEEGDGVVMDVQQSSQLVPNIESISFDDFQFYEKEEYNLLKSGRNWYGDRFEATGNTKLDLQMQFPNTIVTEPAKLFMSLIARSNQSSAYEVRLYGSSEPVVQIPVNAVSFNDWVGLFAREGSALTTYFPTGDKHSVSVLYKPQVNTSLGWFDKMDVQVRRQLKMSGVQLAFRDIRTVGIGNVTQFRVSGVDNNLKIWNVTNPLQPLNVVWENKNNEAVFTAETDNLQEYVIFNPSGSLPVPEYVEQVANQNLHGEANVDYIIVCDPDFLGEAKRLALLHQQYSGLTTLVVTQKQVFNEFSSGQPDVVAIRSFVKMFYDRAAGDASRMPKYLLLFGDGTYKNRGSSVNNRILTYQSVNSLHHTETYVTDDFYGFLDDSEGASEVSDKMDIGVGRFPVASVAEAKIAVDKTFAYLQNQKKGLWRGQLTFVGDDGDNNTHMYDSDRLAVKVSQSNPEFDINKIYFDAYRKVSGSNGQTYPEVNDAVERSVTEGTLIWNYTGHGGERGLAHENVVTIPRILSWTNYDRLSLFVTATCEFSRFDDDDVSAGEHVFLNSKGGGIALLSTTRVVYSSLNYILNDNFYTHVFKRTPTGEKLRLGDIMRLTKQTSGNSVNKLNFTLLGDPALQLLYPDNQVITTHINNKDVFAETDTLKALSFASIDAQVADPVTGTLDNFNGKASITVYDKGITVKTLGNEGNVPFEYMVYQSVLFKGLATVSNGMLSSSFVIPKDIRYHYGKGRISYFAESNDSEAFGAFNEVVIGGFQAAQGDETGPVVKAWLNNKDFKQGNKVGAAPLLLAEIFDENGINTSGNGIGHDITLTIDGNVSSKIVLNNYFVASQDSYQGGTILYQLPAMAPGSHTLTLKVWDTHNNSTEMDIQFKVENSNELSFRKINLYPNPVKSGTELWLNFEHNDPNAAITLDFELHDLSGQLIRKERKMVFSSGVTTAPFSWQAVDASSRPLRNGIYLLRLISVSETGKKGTISQKIVVIE
jgi:hypothetical protein